MLSYLKLALPLILLLQASGCLLASTGCTATLVNDGAVGFEISTRWVLVHEARKTTGEEEPAVSNMEFPALVEWVLGAEKETSGEVGPPAAPEDVPPPTP